MSSWKSLGTTDQRGKRAIVTGANTGLGLHTAIALAGAGAEVVLAVRDQARGEVAAQTIRARFDDATVGVAQLDLADLASVRAFAAAQAAAGPVDILVNNAGLMVVPRRVLTSDGFESQMGVNHLGHFALTAGLLPALSRAPIGRVVSMTSIAARGARSLDHGLGVVGDYNPMTAYGQSKLAVTLFAVELDRRLRAAGSPVSSVVAHPGWSATAVAKPDDNPGLGVRLGRRTTALFGSAPHAGARSVVAAATDPDLTGGELIEPTFLVRGTPHRGKLSAVATDPVSAAWLWDESVRLTGSEPRP